MIQVSQPDFPVDQSLRLVALQGDCGLREELSASGGRYVVTPSDRAIRSCLDVVAHARSVHAHIALIPELAIPETGLDALIAEIEASSEPLVLIGGIEGVSPDAYRNLATRFGVPPDICQTSSGTYVNAMVVVLRTAGATKVFLRAKRFASGAENAGAPQMVVGNSEFIVLELGPKPFVIVPLICAEFTWPDLWERLGDEVPGPIDVMPVLQRNRDVERRYLSPVIHNAYQQNVQTRFVLATREASAAAMSERVSQAQQRVAAARELIASRIARRNIALEEVARSLDRVGVHVAIEAEALGRVRAEVVGRLVGIDEELRAATEAEAEAEAQLLERERSLASRLSRADQLNRLATELRDHAEKLKASLPATTDAIDPVERRSALDASEATLRRLELEHGQQESELSNAEKRIADLRTELAGIQRRRQAVVAVLESIEAEFSSVGLRHDVSALVEAEHQAVARRAELLELKAIADEIAQQQRTLEEGRALVAARSHLDASEQALRALQARQQLLQARSTEFGQLHDRLGTLQNDTAESVLASIRGPVNSLFHAMTAGCPWDLEFRLENGKLGAILTDGSARDLSAISVLNSAYVNVAAIALRLALAGQQRWTTFRSVILDDPILEMDNLTQSALIDGFEAILSSTAAPWRDLQFVLTTWSEDFAVMAAHKLAHLNGTSEPEVSGANAQFIIHRLSSDLDGSTTSQRHVPRWRKSAAAA